jgi:hypothetical protein
MLNWNEIADRFFSCHAGKNTAELLELFGTNKFSLSKWKSYDEKVPMKHLDKTVETEGVTWDWLLEGRGPKHREKER